MNPHPGPLRVLDPDALRNIRELDEPGQVSFLAEIVEAFRASSEGDMTRLGQALDANDREAASNTAHRLKGAAATIGADRMRSIAQALELCGRQTSLAGAEEQLAELAAAREHVLAALAQEMKRPQLEIGG